eukprot:Hpha_TRINITY_DN35198_c0_g1::TRINITY_DN35198_c0_g1_i1::g.168456::m.168456
MAVPGGGVAADGIPGACPEVDLDTLRREGFVVIPDVLEADLCSRLRDRLVAVQHGEFDTGVEPDKVRNLKTVHMLNIWKADKLFSSVIRSPVLGRLAAAVGGWRAARLLQDQVFQKPPQSDPVAFHRDEAYMGEGVVTIWLALDDVDAELGPLEYVPRSHDWEGSVECGFVPFLFDKKCQKWKLNKSRKDQGMTDELETKPVMVSAGGGSIHYGRTWHGSGPNTSKSRSRPGLGIHFVSADATAAEGDPRWRVFKAYAREDMLMDPAHFPVTWAGDDDSPPFDRPFTETA